MENMNEIAGTGFFYSRLGSGDIQFANMQNDEMLDLAPPDFAQSFGSQVQDEGARKEAAGILNELNRSKKMNLSLAEYVEPQGTEGEGMPQDQMAESVLGGLMA